MPAAPTVLHMTPCTANSFGTCKYVLFCDDRRPSNREPCLLVQHCSHIQAKVKLRARLRRGRHGGGAAAAAADHLVLHKSFEDLRQHALHTSRQLCWHLMLAEHSGERLAAGSCLCCSACCGSRPQSIAEFRSVQTVPKYLSSIKGGGSDTARLEILCSPSH